MNKYQSILESKTVWGLFAALISMILNIVGVHIPALEIEQWGASAFDIITKLITLLGLCYALYARIVATKQVVVALPSQVPEYVVKLKAAKRKSK